MDVPKGMRVLFVGAGERGEVLRGRADERGVYLEFARTVDEATGLYLLLAPDVVVLNGTSNSELTREVYLHLSSVGARPLVVLNEGARVSEWRQSSGDGTVVLDRVGGHDRLLETLAEISERIPSLFSMDTHSERTERHRSTQTRAPSR